MDMQDDSKTAEPVRVFVRVRPELDGEGKQIRFQHQIQSTLPTCIEYVDDKTIKISAPNTVNNLHSSLTSQGRKAPISSSTQTLVRDEKTFHYDHVFSNKSDQEDIYYHISPLVKATVRGYNTTVFAYGCTGSGKSHTMTGNSAAPGIIPRAISEIFTLIENTALAERDIYFYVRISYVELYNNHFRNLLEFVSKDSNAVSSANNSTITGNVDRKYDLKSSFLDTELSSSYRDQSTSRNTDGTGVIDNGPTPIRSSLSLEQWQQHQQQQPLQPQPLHVNPLFNATMSATTSVNTDKNSSTSCQRANEKIEVRESTTAGVFLAGSNLRVPVTSAQEAFRLIARGNKLRAVGATQCNDVSSRSHAILTIHVESRTVAPNHTSSITADTTGSNVTKRPAEELRLGKMHLVDLAGSERLTLSGSEGDTLTETQNINLSLSALGDVLSALSKNAVTVAQFNKSAKIQQLPKTACNASIDTIYKTGGANSGPCLAPVPYRNSKLTHLLKDSLGGNSKTIMITTVRCTAEYYQQTAISLMYASRAKKVRNHSCINRDIIGDTGIHAITKEIERLKQRLDDRTHEFERLRIMHKNDIDENVFLKARLEELKQANEIERSQLEVQMKNIIHSQVGQFAKESQKFSNLQCALQEELSQAQNRICDQEREISWLKRALDETAQAAQQPVEQLERMQKVVDAWQCQAKLSQNELSSSLAQIDSLKALNSQLTRDLESSQFVINDLREQVYEKTRHVDELSEIIRQEKIAINQVSVLNSVSLQTNDDEFKACHAELAFLKDQNQILETENMQLKLSIQDNNTSYQTLNDSYLSLKSAFTEYQMKSDHNNVELSNTIDSLSSAFSAKELNYTNSIRNLNTQLSGMENLSSRLQGRENDVTELEGLLQKSQQMYDLLKVEYEESLLEITNCLDSEQMLRKDFRELQQLYTHSQIQLEHSIQSISQLKGTFDDQHAISAAKELQYVQQIESISDQLADAQKQIQALTESSQMQINNLKVSHDENLLAQRQQLTETLELNRSYLTNEISNFVAKCDQLELTVTQLQNLLSIESTRYLDLESGMSNLKFSCDQKVQDLQNLHQIQFNEISSEAEAKLRVLKTSLTQAHNDLERKQQEILEISEKYEQKFNSLVELHANEISNIQANCKNQILSAEELIKSSQLEYESKLSSLAKDHDTLRSQVFKLRSECCQLSSEVTMKSQLLSSSDLTIQSLEQQIQTLQLSYISSQNTISENEVLLIKERNSIQDIRQSLVQLECFKEESMVQTQKLNQAIESLTEQNQETELSLRNQYQGELYGLKSKFESQIKELIDEQRIEMDAAKNTLRITLGNEHRLAMEEQSTRQILAFNEYKVALDGQLATVNQELVSVCSDRDNAIEKAQQMQIKIEAIETESSQRLDRELYQLKCEHDANIKDVQTNYNATVQQLTSQISALNRSLESETQIQSEIVERYESLFQLTEAALVKKQAEAVEACESNFKSQLDYLTEEHRCELNSLASAHHSEIESITLNLEKNCTAQIENLRLQLESDFHKKVLKLKEELESNYQSILLQVREEMNENEVTTQRNHQYLIQQLEEKCSGLSSQLEDRSLDISNLKLQLHQLYLSLEALEIESNEKETLLKLEQQSKNELSSKLSDLRLNFERELNAALNSENSKSKARLDSKDAIISQLTEQLAIIQSQLSQLRSEVEVAKANEASSDHKWKQAESLLHLCQEETAKLRLEIITIQSSHNESLVALRNLIETEISNKHEIQQIASDRQRISLEEELKSLLEKYDNNDSEWRQKLHDSTKLQESEYEELLHMKLETLKMCCCSKIRILTEQFEHDKAVILAAAEADKLEFNSTREALVAHQKFEIKQLDCDWQTKMMEQANLLEIDHQIKLSTLRTDVFKDLHGSQNVERVVNESESQSKAEFMSKLKNSTNTSFLEIDLIKSLSKYRKQMETEKSNVIRECEQQVADLKHQHALRKHDWELQLERVVETSELKLQESINRVTTESEAACSQWQNSTLSKLNEECNLKISAITENYDSIISKLTIDLHAANSQLEALRKRSDQMISNHCLEIETIHQLYNQAVLEITTEHEIAMNEVDTCNATAIKCLRDESTTAFQALTSKLCHDLRAVFESENSKLCNQIDLLTEGLEMIGLEARSHLNNAVSSTNANKFNINQLSSSPSLDISVASIIQSFRATLAVYQDQITQMESKAQEDLSQLSSLRKEYKLLEEEKTLLFESYDFTHKELKKHVTSAIQLTDQLQHDHRKYHKLQKSYEKVHKHNLKLQRAHNLIEQAIDTPPNHSRGQMAPSPFPNDNCSPQPLSTKSTVSTITETGDTQILKSVSSRIPHLELNQNPSNAQIENDTTQGTSCNRDASTIRVLSPIITTFFQSSHGEDKRFKEYQSTPTSTVEYKQSTISRNQSTVTPLTNPSYSTSLTEDTSPIELISASSKSHLLHSLNITITANPNFDCLKSPVRTSARKPKYTITPVSNNQTVSLNHDVHDVEKSDDSDSDTDNSAQLARVNKKLTGGGNDGVNIALFTLKNYTNDDNLSACSVKSKIPSSPRRVITESDKSTPIDQLIGAIFEGDVQRLRTVIQSRGDSLNSPYWKSIQKSSLPLHRALTGLHFHGDVDVLVSIINTLVQCDVDVHIKDRSGCTPLHKALQICTSKNVMTVLKVLLKCGISPNAVNNLCETPLHLECQRLRSSSMAIVELLVDSGCDVNASYSPYPQHNIHSTNAADFVSDINTDIQDVSPTSLIESANTSVQTGNKPSKYIPATAERENSFKLPAGVTVTPLSQVLNHGRKAAYTSEELRMSLAKSKCDQSPFLAHTQLSLNPDALPASDFTGSTNVLLSPTANIRPTQPTSISESTIAQGNIHNDMTLSHTPHQKIPKLHLSSTKKSRLSYASSSSRKYWLPLAQTLTNAGSSWSNEWRDKNGRTYLHLLCKAYPPSHSQLPNYIQLMSRALQAGLNPYQCDNYESVEIFQMMLRESTANRFQPTFTADILHTLLELREEVRSSCLASIQSIILSR